MRSLVLAAAAFVASVSVASATTITQTESYGPQNTDWGPLPLDFAGFNGSLGTLTGVSVTATESASGTLTNHNNGSNAATVTSSLLNEWDADLPTALNSVSDLTNNTLTNSAVDILATGGTGPAHAVAGSTAASTTSTGTDSLTAYESPFVVNVDDSGSLNLHATNGNGNATYTDSGEVSVTVTYTYNAPVGSPPVGAPEPATIALLGSALFGLGLIRRRG